MSTINTPMLLLELFDRPKRNIDWDTQYAKGGSVRAMFDITNEEEGVTRSYGVDFGRDAADPDYWEVEFHLLEGGGDPTTEITGTRGEVAVFSTVMHIIQTFIQKYNPRALFFTAKEPSRKKLYKRMIGRFAKQGWKVTEHPSAFELSR